MDFFQTINPSTLDALESYTFHSAQEAISKLESAHHIQKKFKHSPFSERRQKLLNAKKILLEKKNQLSNLMSLEMGKPLTSANAEIEKCGWALEYFAEHGEDFLKDLPVNTEAQKSYIHFEALGVVLAIMPWNFPYWQVFRFAAPALMAGNAIFLKHAQNVAASALAIEKIFHEAGFEKELFQNIFLKHQDIEKIIAHPFCQAVSLTGSTRAGREVAALCGKHLKKSLLELGGSDAYLVLEDAPLELAATLIVQSRMINGGQSCIAAKRVLVNHKIHQDFLSKVKTEMSKYQMKNPMLADCLLGPLARPDLRDSLHEQVRISVSKGAKLIMGGHVPSDLKGAYYPATIVDNVQPGMPLFDEESFGPVMSLTPCRSDEECLRLANQSQYGLGGGIFSRDLKRAEIWARDYFESGSCFINDYTKSDPRLPFGGIKNSGYGREMSVFGIREFVNIKSIHLGKL